MNWQVNVKKRTLRVDDFPFIFKSKRKIVQNSLEIHLLLIMLLTSNLATGLERLINLYKFQLNSNIPAKRKRSELQDFLKCRKDTYQKWKLYISSST